MKKLALTFFSLSFVCFGLAQKMGTLMDNRDGKTYKTVKIGEQFWMAENLAFNYGSGCWAYDNDSSNITKYGYLYNWETANNVCPSGWHLPSMNEFVVLLDEVGGRGNTAFNSLRKGGNSGFSAPLGGCRYDNVVFDSIGELATFWSSSLIGRVYVLYLDVYIGNLSTVMDINCRSRGMFVRCLQDN